jgi:hypothetical protein
MLLRRGAGGSGGKLSGVFQASVKIIRKNIAAGATFSDFLRCGRFHEPPISFFFGAFFFL